VEINEDIISLLDQHHAAGSIRALDVHFGKFLYEFNQEPLACLIGCLLSFQLSRGSVCLDLNLVNPVSLFNLGHENSQCLIRSTGVPFDMWMEHLICLSCVSDGVTPTPLVLQSSYIYLRRYWGFERIVASRLKENSDMDINITLLKSGMSRLFARNHIKLFNYINSDNSFSISVEKYKNYIIDQLGVTKPSNIDWEKVHEIACLGSIAQFSEKLDILIPDIECLNWQKIAAAVSITKRISVISGGPGTGKTTTVAKLLVLLIEQGLATGISLRIQLAAPTGKASARLSDSVINAIDNIDCTQEVIDIIPSDCSTIHRLLGVTRKHYKFKHDRNNQLHLDVLIVDEASMIDLGLMARLLDALPPYARLILLGDHEQLPSVEAGNLLSDLCHFTRQGYSSPKVLQLNEITGFNLESTNDSIKSLWGDGVCILKKSYRFHEDSGIGKIAGAVNEGETLFFNSMLLTTYSDLDFYEQTNEDWDRFLSMVCKGYFQYLNRIKEHDSPINIIEAFNEFRVLCAVRHGYYGTTNINQAIQNGLINKGLLNVSDVWYLGRPVLITRNDYGLGLFNGDVGITLLDKNGKFRVCFGSLEDDLRYLLPSQLPDHETVFAMTIHKSQGSEFDHAAMVLPNTMNPVLTRELIYTGITRSRRQLSIMADMFIIKKSIEHRLHRHSGLYERIAGGFSIYE